MGLQPKYPNCGLSTFGMQTWLVGLQSIRWIHTPVVLQLGLVGCDVPALIQDKGKPTKETTQRKFPIVKAEYQSELDRSEKKCFMSESQIKIHSLLQISFAFLYLLL